MLIERPWMRWPASLLVFAGATWLNLHLQPQLGDRAPLLPYFPALVIVGLSCGFGPAFALLCASCLAILYFWIPPVGTLFPVESVSNVALIALFFCAGLLIAAVAATAGSLVQKDRRSRQRLRLALAAGRMVTWDWDIEQRHPSTTGDATAIFGRRIRSMEDILQALSADDAATFRQRYAYALDSGGRFSQIAAIVRPDDGQTVWTQIDGYVATDSKGRAAHAYGVLVDVTPQQEALRASQAAEERFQLALESAKVMAWECDEQARYTWAVNVPMGISREQVIGAEVGSVAGQPTFAAAVLDAVRSGQPVTLDQRASHGGRDYQLLTSIRPIQDADGQVRRLLGATVDVTELAAVQQQLLLESQRKDTFLATLAHELRNPMAPIRYAVSVLQHTADEGARHRAVEIIGRQSAHMARLLDDLLDMSRITRNDVALQRQVIDLRTVVKQALEAVEPVYVEKRHRISLSMPPRPVPVEGDPTRLQQVLGNLLDNAAKYSPVPGEVLVHLAVDAGHAKVTVTDRGIGIAKDLLSRVFELFTRLDSSSAAPVGLGIGLAVSRQLIQLHGGTVSVESEGRDRGSRFIVCLPLAEGGVGALPGASTGPASGQDDHEDGSAGNTCVLIVDDNEDGANTLAEVLREARFRTAVAYTGEDALTAFERLHPRVVLLDIGLPDLSGNEVARRLRGRARDELVLVAVTGWGQEADRAATAAAGFDAHVVKPVDATEIEQLIRRLLREPASSAALGTG
ncbi:ATP-binding protein [Mitsuaria sp. GD03876]|uniref:ATP-binding protein n=1 Tax=Mitsuaria sp. GD03876 TaxID=2975399 RepID=UPI002447E653|nr:ATP-binding protein [Mitsuaria sp. GD03876]MDH0863855.1 ATP-binding protein [Mitsuaria sp. GD03876]